jgi:hypothetical protein
MRRLCDWWCDRPWLTIAALTTLLTTVLAPELSHAGNARTRPTSTAERRAVEAAHSSTPTMSAEIIHYLIRATLLSLDDANRTGNYTVMRDLAAPSFQESHTAADLAAIFTEFRRKGLVLSSAALLTPQLVGEPTLDRSNTLHLKGHLPTSPMRLAFDLKYQPVAGSWRLSALAVTAEPAAPRVDTKKRAATNGATRTGWTANAKLAR